MDDIFRPIVPVPQNVKGITRDQNAQDQKQPPQNTKPLTDRTAPDDKEITTPSDEDSVLLSLSYIRTQIGMWSPHDQLPSPDNLPHLSPETRHALSAYHKMQGYYQNPGQKITQAHLAEAATIDQMIDQLESKGLTAIPVFHGEALADAVTRAYQNNP